MSAERYVSGEVGWIWELVNRINVIKTHFVASPNVILNEEVLTS